MTKSPQGLPIGKLVKNWSPPPRPPRTAMEGQYCRVELLNPKTHGPDLFKANSTDKDGTIWIYLPYGPFETSAAYMEWLVPQAAGEDPLFHAIVDKKSGRALGVATYLRITPDSGSIEVGHICYSPELQGTRVATEAMYLMMKRVFDELGYRRYEWKCNALNDGSRRAARRLGFTYEGTFRQATVSKGRNRDTAWYAMIDQEWPALKAAFEAYLAPGNFSPDGRQKKSLSALTAAALNT